jgi:hypothetical protein
MGGDNVVPCANGSVCAAFHGVYGQEGVPAAGNAPGGRAGATSWTDKNGNLWLFGGLCDDSTGTDGWCNDLWTYSTITNEWTWVSGSSTLTCGGGYCAASISYGTLGVADPGNLPPGRQGAVGWTDTNGNLWLFSGESIVETGVDSYLNDLWMFNVTTDEWTWMGGDSAIQCPGGNCDGASGIYGTLGSPAPANLPGARWFASAWTDRSGNFWLFGGEGMVAGGGNFLNDPASDRFTPQQVAESPAAQISTQIDSPSIPKVLSRTILEPHSPNLAHSTFLQAPQSAHMALKNDPALSPRPYVSPNPKMA